MTSVAILSLVVTVCGDLVSSHGWSSSKIPRPTMFLTGSTVLLHCTLSFLLLPVFVQSVPARGLIYSATADYRHDSIPTARDALTAQGQSINVQFDATEDNTRFTNAGLASYDVLIFLMNTGEGSVGTALAKSVVLQPGG